MKRREGSIGGEYRQRIEQVIGKIKNVYGRLERTKSYEMAKKYI